MPFASVCDQCVQRCGSALLPGLEVALRVSMGNSALFKLSTNGAVAFSWPAGLTVLLQTPVHWRYIFKAVINTPNDSPGERCLKLNCQH